MTSSTVTLHLCCYIKAILPHGSEGIIVSYNITTTKVVAPHSIFVNKEYLNSFVYQIIATRTSGQQNVIVLNYLLKKEKKKQRK